MLTGKIALITGATRGIGKAIAEIYAKNGASIILNARDESAAFILAKKLSSTYNVTVHVVIFDVSNSTEVKNGFKQIFKLTKKLDIVVNNAGILESSLLGMVTESMIEKTYSTNVYSLYYIAQYAARLMARNKSGSIINLTSIMGVNGSAGQAVYSGSKAAVVGITKSLAKELASTHIRVNAIAPGFIDTDMTQDMGEDKYKERMDSIAMGRIGTSEDIANTALYLASDLSSYVTGQTIAVDGGMLI
ncbi:MAG TPA: SDR family oxidoreductase [Arcobacter sp.]|nr:SDR family oxidoreductase [Arcobacter sp.]